MKGSTMHLVNLAWKGEAISFRLETLTGITYSL